MFLLYNLLFPLLVLCYLPYYFVHCIRRGGLTVDFWERFGIFPSAVKARLKALKAPLWIHAVSVGETVEAVSFIKLWLKRHPEAEVVFSCGTATGFATAKKKLPSQVVPIYCPLDCWWMVRHALKLVHPKTLAILEVEIWPNLILQSQKAGVKTVLVNGRMSDRSSRRYAKFSWIFQRVFGGFSSLCVQTEEDAQRIRRVIGADRPERLKVVGTVKFDQVPDANAGNTAAEFDDAFGNRERLVFCAGSTHSGEEELMCRTLKSLRVDYPQLRMALVPRHAERGAEVVKVIESCGLSWKSAVAIDGATPSCGEAEVLLVNTTGQLMNYYSCSDICYVGKSLCGQTGGHNIIEPAIFGKAIIYGSHMENFRQVDEIFQREKSGVVVQSDDDFLQRLKELVCDPRLRDELGRNARATVERHRGAIDRTLDEIDRLG